MTLSEYESTVKHLSDLADEIANSKRPDYTEGDVDVLANFKNQAKECGLTPEQVWMVHMGKQMSAIRSYMKGKRNPSEAIELRFADARNYLNLGYALIQDKPSPLLNK